MKRVCLPHKLEELWSSMQENPGALLFAGGTDLLVKMRSGRVDASRLIGLEQLSELKGISKDKGIIRIGACVTHTELLSSPLIAKHLPVLHQALVTLGSPPIRNMGTIGGNICTASPAGDTLPPLYVLDAGLEIAFANGCRLTPIKDFITAPGKNSLREGEILSAICVKIPAQPNLQRFEKIGQRQSMSCSIASLAALLKVLESGIIESAHLAWGSVGPTVVTDINIEAFLTGKKLARETISATAEMAALSVAPIDDVRASADYRRLVSGRLLLRLLNLPPQ